MHTHAGLGAAFGDGSNVNNGANGSIRIYYLNFNRFFYIPLTAISRAHSLLFLNVKAFIFSSVSIKMM